MKECTFSPMINKEILCDTSNVLTDNIDNFVQ